MTVDFDELGKYGLFGIFGSIGSGKSTLLDAMTLALYGLVDRVATRSRRGLVNLGSDRCEVRLTFIVDGPAGPERYEVQRNYREREGIAQRTASRLVQVGPMGHRVVVADKERDVNDAVADVVGLGAEDFMRAVVLPQGRFMQLLHLKGSERRQMLQRIFRLHAYGDGLRKQLRERQAHTRDHLSEARGEIAGLGDASAGAVKRARRATATARAARRAAEGSHAVALLRHDQAARRYEGQARLTAARSELEAHRARLAEVTRSEARVEAAERVRPIVQPAMQWRQATTQAEAESARSDAVCREEQAARHALTAAQGALGEARSHANTEVPKLQRRVAELERVLEHQRQLREGEARVDAQRAALDTHQAALQAIDAEQQAARERVGEHVAERTRLRRRHRKQSVAAQEREQSQRAARAADALARCQRLVTEAREKVAEAAARRAETVHQLADVQSRSQAARQAHTDAVESLAALQSSADWLGDVAVAELDARLIEGRRLRVLRVERATELEARETTRVQAESRCERAAAAVTAADAAVHAARQVQKGAEAALREAQARNVVETRRRTTADLARALVAEGPCPVCGSPHHPAPATPDEGGSDHEAAVVAHLEGRRRAVERHEAVVAAHARAVAFHESAETQRLAAVERLTEARAALASTGPEDQEAEATLIRARALRTEARALEQHIQQAAVVVERAAAPVAAAEARVAEADAAVALAEALLQQRSDEEGAAWDVFDAERGALTLFDVANAVAALEARDRRAEALFGELEAIDRAIHAKQQTVDALAVRASAAAAAASAGEERLAGAIEQRDQARAQLATSISGPDPATEARQATLALEALLAAQSAAETLREAAGETHHRLAQERAAAEAASRIAQARVAEARGALDVALKPFGHSSETLEERLSSLQVDGLDPDQIATMRLDCSAWRQTDAALHARVSLLEDDTEAVPPPSDDELAALNATWTDASAALEAARDRAVESARDAATLEDRAPRWAAVTEVIAALESELARLDALSAVLRGDRFVEYVANDHLTELTARASRHLAALTGDRYHLEIDDEAAFQVRDADAGGAMRPVHTLSGGEAFLTALSLALALSTQVQTRSSRPLGFFFLDEGFGTLDPEALDRVMSAIEALRDDTRVIGLISHVPAVRERVPRYLQVTPAGKAHAGSSVALCDN